MSISKKDVEYVANLSRIELTSDEKNLFAGQLGRVLEYMSKLNEVETINEGPMSQSSELKNVFRDDVQKEPPGVSGALANAPEKKDNLFCVPPVIE